MAYSHNSLVNLVSGNVRNCTFYLMKGEQIARRKTREILNPRTAKQQLNRSNIRPLLDCFRQLKPLLYLSLNDRKENQTAYNKFMSINLNHSVKKGILNPSNLRLTSEGFDSTEFNIIRQIDNQDNFRITWDEDTDEQRLSSDKLMIAYYNYGSGTFQYAITRKSRTNLAAEISFNLKSINSMVLLYLFFVRSDYSKSSKLSIYDCSQNTYFKLQIQNSNLIKL